MPGSTPATSQLDWLSSTTAMIVLSWSKATRDLLKSFSWGIGALRQLFASDDGAISSPPAPYHLSAGGRWIRTVGPPYEGNDKRAECHIFKRRTGAEAQVRWNKAADRSRPTRDQPYRILPPPTSLFGDRPPRWGP